MVKIVFAVVWGILAFFSLIISILSFMEKGFLFHNAYIWASKQERDRMDKKPYYRQSAIVFALGAAVFLCMAVEFVLMTGWLWIGIGACTIAALIYAVASDKEISKGSVRRN